MARFVTKEAFADRFTGHDTEDRQTRMTRDISGLFFRGMLLFAGVVFAGLAFSPSALAQQGTIEGTVVDSAAGEPLQGVNIVIRDTQQGTTTDAEGTYSLRVQSGSYTLAASFVGYQTETRTVEVEAGETVTEDFMLRSSEVGLENVVVTALGVERQERSLSYSQQEVDGAGLSEARELNVANSLSGEVAGIQVNQAATGVGGEERIILRGNRSITGSSQPLYVVDGMPIQGSLSDLNPNDIANISVLKGPNAAALYGSEAQNGVIVITTKGGQEGDLSFTFNQNVQFRDPILLTDYQNQYGQGSGGSYQPGSEFSWGPSMDGQTVDYWSPNPDAEIEEVPYSPQPNNVRDAFRMGYNSSTNISATGGTGDLQGRLSYGFTTANGIVPRNELERHNLTGRLSYQVADDLSMNGKLQYSNQTIQNSLSTGESFSNPIRHIYRLPRNIRTQDAENFEYITNDGLRRQHYWNPGSNGGANPYWTINRNLNTTSQERVIVLTSLTYDLLDPLSLTVRGSYDGTSSRGETKLYNDSYIIADNGQYSLQRNNNWEGNGEFLLEYSDQLLEDVSVDATFGGNIRKERGGALTANTGTALTVPNFFAISNTQNVQASQGIGSPREVHSLYGSTEFGWQDALFLSVTGRNDWSSTLPPENRSFFYPSVGLSAVLSDLVSLPEAVSYAQLRGSWARVGNSAPPFQTVRTASFTAGGNNGFISLSNTLPAEDLVPEETVSYEFGLDTRFFDERVSLNTTIYETSTQNQLFTTALPPGSGASLKFVNGGDVENRGLEITLSGRPVQTSTFNSNLELNFAANRSEVVRLTEEQDVLTLSTDFLRAFRIEEGEPFGQVYSRGFVRDDQGRIVVNSNGMPEITDGMSVQVADFNPDWTGGFGGSVSYNNVSMSFLIEHRQGGSASSLTNAILDADGLRERTLQGRDGDGVVVGEDVFGDETAVQEDGSSNNVAIDPETLWRNLGGRNAPVGEAFVEDATNTRLRKLTLGYSLPESVIETLPVSSVRFSLVGRNLLFLHRASSNLDPDLLVGTSAASEGFASFQPPTTRTFGVDLQINY